MKNGFRTFIKEGYIQTAVTLVGILVVILNLYLASKLSPISENLAVVIRQVEANTKRIENTVADKEINLILVRLDRIERQLDVLINR